MNMSQIAMHVQNFTMKQTMNIEAQQMQKIVESGQQVQEAVDQNIAQNVAQNGHIDIRI